MTPAAVGDNNEMTRAIISARKKARRRGVTHTPIRSSLTNEEAEERSIAEPPQADPILRVQGVAKSFGGLQAVAGCNISVGERTVTGLVGPNGAGKTTLFNLITGFLPLDAGRIWFRSERIDGLSAYRVMRRGLVRTFQIPRPFSSMSVLENVMLFAQGQREAVWDGWLAPRRVARKEKEIYDKSLEILEFVNLSHLRDISAGHLSGGQRKLLELARALMADPVMILLDEPGAGINPTLAKQLMAGVQRLRRERGITFIVIEHDMDLVFENCDPVIVMTGGRQLMEGKPEEVKHDERVLEAYLGE